ncbi:unnamed protein product [Sphenostylis stenocarpa]|uniref:Uncharacterized protein n=1 Tax=Sphenostylis stenocarpa TaxID=92480 RepID=A0AA86VYU2_9FABA|nr:unnamed protein product [Sphenostylis stenocarpa]
MGVEEYTSYGWMYKLGALDKQQFHFRSVVLSGRRWMAKNNKYASINFNHIYEKTTATNPHNRNPSHSPSPSSSSYSSASYSAVSAPNKTHGRILVLTRPTPKPITPPTPQPHHPPPSPIHHTQSRSEPGSDSISLRPLGRTGTTSSLSSLPVLNHDIKDLPSPQPKTDKFVPPHLRPGFVPREETPPGPDSLRPNGRPKSGGGQERMRRGGPDAGIMGRRSRPSSSGCALCLSGTLKSLKTKTDQVADFQHITSQLLAKFAVLVEGSNTQVLVLVFDPLLTRANSVESKYIFSIPG